MCNARCVRPPADPVQCPTPGSFPSPVAASTADRIMSASHCAHCTDCGSGSAGRGGVTPLCIDVSGSFMCASPAYANSPLPALSVSTPRTNDRISLFMDVLTEVLTLPLPWRRPAPAPQKIRDKSGIKGKQNADDRRKEVALNQRGLSTHLETFGGGARSTLGKIPARGARRPFYASPSPLASLAHSKQPATIISGFVFTTAPFPFSRVVIQLVLGSCSRPGTT